MTIILSGDTFDMFILGGWLTLAIITAVDNQTIMIHGSKKLAKKIPFERAKYCRSINKVLKKIYGKHKEH